MTTSHPRLRLGTRASALARWQAQWVADRLGAAGIDVELVPITTSGDATQHVAIAGAAEPGVFTKELERALVEERIDLAVHSLKDLPTELAAGLVIAAVPQRESPRDVLVSRSGMLDELPPGAVVGTGSVRRRSQLLFARQDLDIRDVRGNVDTRLAKLAAGQYDALVLAHAGLKRLQLEERITQIFDCDVMMPAVGQGALAIETRAVDKLTRDLIATLDDPPTHRAIAAERALLAALAGGCLAPIGALAGERRAGELALDAVVLSADGRTRLAAGGSGSSTAAVELALHVARELLAQGAAALISQSRNSD